MYNAPLRPSRRAVAGGLAASILDLGRKALAQGAENGQILPLTWTATPVRKPLRLDAGGTAGLWSFNGQVPGPLLRVRHGDEIRLKLANDTPKPLSLHWHGVRGPNAMDGVGSLTQPPVMPGETFDYRLIPPDPGTFLIRPCVLGGSAEPQERGLTAVLIVEETSPLRVDHDVALVVDDWLLDEAGELTAFAPSETPSGVSGRLGNWLSVNAAAVPERISFAPGARVRLRLVNASNARSMRLRFDRLRPYVIAVDGQPTESFEPLNGSVPFVPGSRYDLVIELPSEAGSTGSVVGLVGAGVPLITLLTAGSQRPAAPPTQPLPRNPLLPTGLKLQNAVRKDVAITSNHGSPSVVSFLLNGKSATPGIPPLLTAKRGTPVVLTIKNQTALPQPIHLHGHVFRVLHSLDDGWDPYFLDTMQVPEDRTVRIAFLADNPGKWLLASTVLERFDAGLWTWIEII